MLSKKHRLSKTVEVRTTTVKGRGFFNPYFVIKSLPNKLDSPRITVIVSTKVSKKAVDRNRIKRVIRDELRKQLESLPQYDYAVVVKPSITKIDNTEIRAQIKKAITIIGSKK